MYVSRDGLFAISVAGFIGVTLIIWLMIGGSTPAQRSIVSNVNTGSVAEYTVTDTRDARDRIRGTEVEKFALQYMNDIEDVIILEDGNIEVHGDDNKILTVVDGYMYINEMRFLGYTTDTMGM